MASSKTNQKNQNPQSQQSERFIAAARELGCDESEERFVETIRKLASAPPAPRSSKAKKPKSE